MITTCEVGDAGPISGHAIKYGGDVPVNGIPAPPLLDVCFYYNLN